MNPADAEVWVDFGQLSRAAPREGLAMRLEVLHPPDKTFKPQPFLLQREVDLAEVDLVSSTLQKRACRPLAGLFRRPGERRRTGHGGLESLAGSRPP